MGMSESFSIATFVMGLLMIGVTFMVVRLVALWFFKISKIISLLEEINSKLAVNDAAGAPIDVPAAAFPLRARRAMASALVSLKRKDGSGL